MGVGGGGGGANWSLTGVGRLGDLKQHRSRLQVSDFESREVDVVDVVLGFAQIVWMETKKRRVHRQTQTLARAMRQEYLVGGGLSPVSCGLFGSDTEAQTISCSAQPQHRGGK